MKQIKTITAKVKNAEKFDEKINKALAKGWRLVKRDVLLNPPRLYVELERDDYVPEGARCDNCKEFDRKESIHALCHRCRHLNQWSPKP